MRLTPGLDEGSSTAVRDILAQPSLPANLPRDGDLGCSLRVARSCIRERPLSPVIGRFDCKILQEAAESLKELAEETLQGHIVDLASVRELVAPVDGRRL